jgi:hypothetical protein
MCSIRTNPIFKQLGQAISYGTESENTDRDIDFLSDSLKVGVRRFAERLSVINCHWLDDLVAVVRYRQRISAMK